MRAAAFVVAFAVFAAVPGFAEPITDPASVVYDTADLASALSDFEGALSEYDGTFMLLAHPKYLRLPVHGKLRGGQNTGQLFLDSFLAGLGFGSAGADGAPGSSGGNGAGDSSTGNDDGNGADNGDGGVGGDGPGGDGIGGGDDNGPAARVPEPGLLMLAAPAALFALRRRSSR